MSDAPRATPSREGLREYALVLAFLVVAAAGAVILFGDEVRAALGLRSSEPPAAVEPAPAPRPPEPR